MKNSKLVVIFLIGFSCQFSNALDVPNAPDSSNGSSKTPKNPEVPSIVLKSPVVGAGLQGNINEAIETCNSSSATAHTSCLTELNPDLQKATGIIGLLLSTVGTMTSTSESCGKYNKALKVAETALTAYNGMCSAGQMSCSSSCSASSERIKQAIASLEKAQAGTALNPAEVAAVKTDVETLRNASTGIDKKFNVCQGYKMNLAAASVGLMNVVKQSSMASSCQAQTSADCTKDPNNVACKTATLDCTKAENSSNTQCICMANPTSPGCAGYTGTSTAYPTAKTGADPTATDSSKGTPNFSGVDSGVTAGNAGGGSVGGASALGSAGGGGGGGGLGGGGTNANAKAGADGKSQKASANILSGYEGGGGGGGRSGGGRPDFDSAYKAYMPGGAKDPTRGIASKTFGNGEVTAAGSKSNWEKVSERYMDNKPTLMGP